MYYLLYLSKSLSIFLLWYAAPTKCLKPPQPDRGAHTQGLVAPPLGFKDSKNLSLKKKKIIITMKVSRATLVITSAHSQKSTLPDFAVVSWSTLSRHR